jgi:hypothetical protein
MTALRHHSWGVGESRSTFDSLFDTFDSALNDLEELFGESAQKQEPQDDSLRASR